MFRLTLVLRLTTHLAAASALILTMGATAHGDTIVINNGLAPPNPENVIDDRAYETYGVYIRNAGCPPAGEPDPAGACPSPGDPTEVDVVNGGALGWVTTHESSVLTVSGGEIQFLFALNSSSVTINNGSVEAAIAYDSSAITLNDGGVQHFLRGYDSSTVTMNGGIVVLGLSAGGSSNLTMNGGIVMLELSATDSSNLTMNGGVSMYLHTFDSSTVTVNGGTVFSQVLALDSSNIRIIGTDFRVDGAPVPYGDLAALTGTLTGTLASGDLVDNLFCQGGSYCTGTITLAPAVAIDIRPWSDANPVNPMSKGVIPVAILGSDTFNVAYLDVTTLAFGPNGAAPAHRKGGHLQNVNDDVFMDLVSHYRTEETGIAFGDPEACVTGETLDGTPVAGCDSINSQPNCGNGFQAALALPPVVWIGGRMRRRRR